MKKLIIIFGLVIVILLGVVTYLLVSDRNSEDNQDEQQSELIETGINETYEESFTIGELEYSVNSYEVSKTLNRPNTNFTASEGNTFIEVDLSARSNSSERIGVPTLLKMNLIDSEGIVYNRVSSEVTFGEDSIINQRVQPGLSASGYLVFEVPEGTEPRGIGIFDADTNTFVGSRIK